MSRPSESQKNAKKNASAKQVSFSPRNVYLIAYNGISAALWAAVLAQVVMTASSKGPLKVFAEVGDFTKWTQTLAALEVVHSLIGLVRAPVLTTIMQVASRFLLVWGICHFFPKVPASSIAYTTMLLAWSTTEVIRYSYFALNLATGGVPAFMTWLRYNTFFVLYPLGISSECWLVWLSVEPARSVDERLVWGLWVVMGVYVPGAYILFTHMMAQRRKIMRGSASKKRQ